MKTEKLKSLPVLNTPRMVADITAMAFRSSKSYMLTPFPLWMIKNGSLLYCVEKDSEALLELNGKEYSNW